MKHLIKSTYIISLLLLSFCIQSCSKYEEGPKVSFYSKKKRVIGNWKIYSHSVDGKRLNDVEILSKGTLKCDFSNNYIDYTNTRYLTPYNWEFKEASYINRQEWYHREVDAVNTRYDCFIQYKTFYKYIDDGGDWEFSDDKKQIILKPYFGTISKISFDIKKLAYSEMRIVGKIDGKEHDITLTRND